MESSLNSSLHTFVNEPSQKQSDRTSIATERIDLINSEQNTNRIIQQNHSASFLSGIPPDQILAQSKHPTLVEDQEQ